MPKYVTTRGSFKIQGLDELKATLTRMPNEVRDKALHKGTREGAEVIQRAAVANAPAKTGNLRRNIVVRKNRGTMFDAEHSVVIRAIGKRGNPKNAYYASFIEYGTSKMSAQPFMRPAFDENKESAVSVLTGYIREAIAAFRIKR